MGLREIAEADNGNILRDDVTGFGFSIILTDPTGAFANLTGFTNDIAQVIDPDTGQAVSGRSASCAIHIQDILDEGLTLPQAIADSGSKPWIVTFNEINGQTHTFKISQSNPDRAVGMLICVLELYKA
jgi:hypothetical protein